MKMQVSKGSAKSLSIVLGIVGLLCLVSLGQFSWIQHNFLTVPPQLESMAASETRGGGKEKSQESAREGVVELCSHLHDTQPASVSSFWLEELDAIRASLLHSPANEPFGKKSNFLRTMVEQVVDALPLARLRRSLRPSSQSADHHGKRIHRIINTLWSRYKDPKAPKLKVLVFGGSPTAGSNCERNRKYKSGACAWPGHLEAFTNDFLGFEAVDVVNYAMGATSSTVATMMLNFRLFPASMQPDGPDIIINAYAINDFSMSLEDNGKTHSEEFHDFVESTNSLRSCDGTRPLVIYLDDFVVNYQKGQLLHQGEAYNSEIATLTQWYQIWTVGYSDMVREILYGNRTEQFLLIDWMGDTQHHPWAGHVAIVLSLIFNAADTVFHFCDDLADNSRHTSQEMVSGVPAAPTDSAFRPSLDGRLSAVSITSLWSLQEVSHKKCEVDSQSSCAFAWVALRREAEMTHLKEMEDVVKEMDGWSIVTSWPPQSRGIYANAVGGVMVLEVKDPDRLINIVSLYYMKSYSEKWIGSEVEASILVGSANSSTLLASVQLSGFHDKQTSEYYMESLRFIIPERVDVDSVRLHLKFVAGGTFKISGVAFCSI